MRKNFGVKPAVYPMPVFILAAYDENGLPNAMNAAWGGISEENQISVCLAPSHKTVKNLLARGAFTINVADAAHVIQCDYVGIVSGNSVPEKFAKAGFHAEKSEFVDAPVITELPLAVECKVKLWEPETGRLVGEILNVSADTSVLAEDGNPDPVKVAPLVFDPFNHIYLKVGEKVGTAFSDGKKLK